MTKPSIYKFWCSSAQDIYNERIAIGRADARIPDDQPTPQHLEQSARDAAQREQSMVEQMTVNQSK